MAASARSQRRRSGLWPDRNPGAMRTAFGPAPAVKLRVALVCGPPTRVILNRCADADLLVLGGHHADSPLRQTAGAANER